MSKPVAAQLSSLSGDADLSYQYRQRQLEGSERSEHIFRQQYNLQLDGRVFHPRLAAFSLFGGFGASLFSEDDIRSFSFGGQLALLQGAPYSLTLRHLQSHTENSTDTDFTTSGLNFRLAFPHLPRLSFDLEREELETRGDSPSDVTRTRGVLRLSKQTTRSRSDAELRLRITEDNLANTTEETFLARVSHTVELSPATSIRAIADTEFEEDRTIVRSAFSLLNRPDPTFSRTLDFRHRFRDSGGTASHEVDTAGTLSKSFRPFPWLLTNATTSLSVSGVTGSDRLFRIGWSGGPSVVLSYYRPVLVTASYNLGLAYQEVSDEQPYEMTHQAHLGLQSQTLDPFRLSADYFLDFRDGTTDSTRHLIISRADLFLARGLSLGTFAEFQRADIRLSGTPPRSFEQQITSMGVETSYAYRPFFNLALDLSGSFRWTDTLSETFTIGRVNANLRYVLPFLRGPIFEITGSWQYFSLDDQTDYEIAGRLSHRIGQLILEAEIRFRNGDIDRGNLIGIRIRRPFRVDF
jgi:hypothetical protein